MPIEGAQKRLFEDPYAEHLYAGSAMTRLLLKWMSPAAIFGLLGNVDAGLQPAMAGRTAEFDTQVRAAIDAGCKQYAVPFNDFVYRGAATSKT